MKGGELLAKPINKHIFVNWVNFAFLLPTPTTTQRNPGQIKNKEETFILDKKGNVCLSVCVFSIEIQTAGRIGTKFGTEVVLEGGGRFLSLNTFFNTYFESSRATPGNPS